MMSSRQDAALARLRAGTILASDFLDRIANDPGFNAKQCRALEQDAHSFYERFQQAGCSMMVLSSDDYDSAYSWSGFKGAKADHVAVYHQSHRPDHQERVLIAMDLTRPFEDQWRNPGSIPLLHENPIVTIATPGEIEAFDRGAFEANRDENVRLLTQTIMDIQLPEPPDTGEVKALPGAAHRRLERK